MRFYWLQDRVKQGQFRIFWAPGSVNFGDYYTKHHSITHHRRVRPIYLHTATSPSSLQGCVELLIRRDQRANQTAHEQTKQAHKPATKPPKRNSPQPTNTSTIAINALAKAQSSISHNNY
jgi:hypothetical protein